MPMSLSRLCKLAGRLMEGTPYVLSADEADDLDDQDDNSRYQREARITTLIRRAFKQLGIRIADDDDFGSAVFYTEDDREATVKLDDSEIDIALLTRLQQSGLAHRYKVQVGADHTLDIVFIVSPDLDQAA